MGNNTRTLQEADLTFAPYRHRLWAGLYLLAGISLLALLLAGGWQVWWTLQTGRTPPFWAWFLGLVWLPLPWLVYHTWLLWRARYTLSPQGLEIYWGRERVQLAWTELEWAGLLNDYPEEVTLPPKRWPGLWTGLGQTAQGRVVRVYATWSPKPVLLATERGVWVIAPVRVGAFLEGVRSFLEPEAPVEGPTALAAALPEEATLQLVDRSPGPAPSLIETQEEAPALSEFPADTPAEPEPTPEPPTSTIPQEQEGTEEQVASAVRTSAPGTPLRRDPLALTLLAANSLLLTIQGVLWWQAALQGRWAEAPVSAYLLIAHGWLLGMGFALGFYVYARPQQRGLSYVLWMGELVLGTLLLTWLGMYAMS